MKLLPFLFALLLVGAPPAWAGPGHEHGDEAAKSAGPSLPRFAASSELFELVGVLEGRRLTLYLDHAPSNAPVTTAELELEIGAAKLSGTLQADGTLRLELPAAPEPGLIPVTATVRTAEEADLLATELDLHAAAEAAHTRPLPAWSLIPAAGGLALLAVWVWRRRAVARRAA